MASAETAKDEQTFPCRICTRRFIKSSLDKHEQACKKLTKMQRKVFDSGKQRALNSDIPINDVRKVQKEREKMGGVFPRPQTNWRERHEEFISAVSASKQVGNALKTGAPLPPPPKTASNAGKFNKTKNFKNKFKDYIKCDFCGRSFNKNAAERHIEFCKEQSVRKAILSKQGRQKTSECKFLFKTYKQIMPFYLIKLIFSLYPTY
uniref:C2HC/C3H-type domain-containing protein n=1 Tax=Meloidogyne enterolobii TaxID=390850 RepID=A0A6V7VT40_MELEN|nr:unnamed protein product [Meloidogyne enterolobii]